MFQHCKIYQVKSLCLMTERQNLDAFTITSDLRDMQAARRFAVSLLAQNGQATLAKHRFNPISQLRLTPRPA